MPADFPDTRWSLIARLPGAPAEAAVVVALYADAIAGYLRACFPAEGRRGRLDDLVQEALLDLLGKPEVLARARPQAGGRFRWYLMNLAWHAAMNALRRERRAEAALAAGGDPAALPAPERRAAMDRAWAQAVIAAALAEVRAWAGDGRCDAQVPAVLDACLVQGRPLRAAAAALGMATATCQRRLAHGRTLLVQALAARLRLAGELGADEDPAAACDLLLAALRD